MPEKSKKKALIPGINAKTRHENCSGMYTFHNTTL